MLRENVLSGLYLVTAVLLTSFGFHSNKCHKILDPSVHWCTRPKIVSNVMLKTLKLSWWLYLFKITHTYTSLEAVIFDLFIPLTFIPYLKNDTYCSQEIQPPKDSTFTSKPPKIWNQNIHQVIIYCSCIKRGFSVNILSDSYHHNDRGQGRHDVCYGYDWSDGTKQKPNGGRG